MAEAKKSVNLKVFAYVFLILVFIAGVFIYIKMDNAGASKATIAAFTEKNTYSLNDELKVQINNDESQRICFSSCYPYVVQSRDGSWDNYPYPACESNNVADTCVEPGETKAFAISLGEMFLEPKMNRLALPACVGCALGEQFRVDKIIYTNEFQITK